MAVPQMLRKGVIAMSEPEPLQSRVDVPPELADAVDLLVTEKGVNGAEQHLQQQFTTGDQERASAALSYLRAEHVGGQA